MSTAKFLFTNGVLLPPPETPSVATFLETHPGAYTTTRTHNNGEFLLFWDRHLKRLSNSLHFLLSSNPRLVFGPRFSRSCSFSSSMNWDSLILRCVNDAMRNALPFAIKERISGEELAISTLVGGNSEGVNSIQGRIEEEMIDRVLDVYVHIGMYVPPVFGVEGNGARLVVVGCRRDFAEAKYSDWARLRKPLEMLRPPSATELLLSDNGDQILEWTITNFFVVRFKGNNEVTEKSSITDESLQSYELQTAPVYDGVLPGVIPQLVIEALQFEKYHHLGHNVTVGKKHLLQHVETIQAPRSWTSLESESWKEVSWVEKNFKGSPGMITASIQKELMKRTGLEGYPLALYNRL